MFIISDFIGENSLANEWTDALFGQEFEYLVSQAEKYTSVENVQSYLSQMFQLLQSISVSDLAVYAEKDVLLLEELCRRFYHQKKHKSEYAEVVHKLLTYANFPYEDKELRVTLGVLTLSTNYRIWACRKCLYEIYSRAREMSDPSFDLCMFIEGNWHPAMCDMQNWLKSHYAVPTLARTYLHAFDLKVLSYYTRRFYKKSAYEYMREYVREHGNVRLS